MPAVNFYLNQEILEAIKAKSKAHNVPVSRIIREAVTQYLNLEQIKELKERVIKNLVEERPFGAVGSWEETHKERSGADIDRS